MGIFSDAAADFAPPSGPDIEAYIKDAATQRGIDPNIATQVYRSEGAGAYVGDQGSSFGPFQLHYGNVAKGGNAVSGLGDTFTKQTGLDARDPMTWRQQIDFSLDQAKSGGWGPWHGWKGDPYAGIGQATNGYGPTYGGPTGAPRIDIAPPRGQTITGTAPVARNQVADFIQSIPGGIAAGTGNILSAVGNAANVEMSQPNNPTVSPEQATAAIEQNITGPLPQPQGRAGRYGRAIGEFLPYTLTTPPQGGLVRTAFNAVAPAIASQSAGEATQGTPYEGIARAVAPMVSTALGRPATMSPAQIEAGAAKAGAAAELPTTQQLLSTGAKQINAAGAAATKTFSPDEMGGLVSQIENTLKGNNSREYMAQQTFNAIQELKNENSAEGIQNVRSLLGEIGTAGGQEGRAVRIAQGEIDKFLQANEPNIAGTLAEGRANYAAGMRSKESDIRGQVAELRANRAGYGGAARAVNAVRQVLSPVVEKYIKGEKNGLSPEEFKAMYDIVYGTRSVNALRGLGMFSPEKGSFPMIATIEAAREAGPEVAAAIPFVSYVSNKLAHVMTENQIQRLNELIRKRSPLYEKAVSDAARRYADTMNEFSGNPSQQSFAKFLVASRNLSAGFRKDGIPLSSGDLLKGLKAAPAAEGEDDQQNGPPVAGK